MSDYGVLYARLIICCTYKWLRTGKIIGNFPQGDSAIYSDYEELLDKTMSGDIEHGIIGNLLETASVRY